MSTVTSNKLLLFEQIKGGRETYTSVKNVINPIITNLIQKDFNISGILTFDSEINIATNAYSSESSKYVYYYNFSSHITQYIYSLNNITSDNYNVYVNFPNNPTVYDIIEDVVIVSNNRLKFIFTSKPTAAINGIQIYLVKKELTEIIKYHTHDIEDIQFDKTNTGYKNTNLYDILLNDIRDNLPMLTYKIPLSVITTNGSYKVIPVSALSELPQNYATKWKVKLLASEGITPTPVNEATDGFIKFSIANTTKYNALQYVTVVLVNKVFSEVMGI